MNRNGGCGLFFQGSCQSRSAPHGYRGIYVGMTCPLSRMYLTFNILHNVPPLLWERHFLPLFVFFVIYNECYICHVESSFYRITLRAHNGQSVFIA